MATKAERFNSEQMRSRPKRSKQPFKRTKGRRRAPTGPEAVRENAATPAHNYHAGEKGAETYAYEYSTRRPSRLSTRTSEDHVKTGVGLQIRQINRTHAPQARAGRKA